MGRGEGRNGEGRGEAGGSETGPERPEYERRSEARARALCERFRALLLVVGARVAVIMMMQSSVEA